MSDQAPISVLQQVPSGAAFDSAVQGTLTLAELITTAQELSAAGQAQAAIALYRLWLEHSVSPFSYVVRFNLAIILADAGDAAGAETMYRAAIEQNPNFVEARLNLGTLLERGGRQVEAIATWNDILTQVQPPVAANQALHLQTLNNLGRLLEIMKQYPMAESMLAHSLRVKPDQDGAMSHWVHLRQKQCEWPVFSGLDHIPVEAMMHGTSALAMLSASSDPAEQLAAARRFVQEKVLTNVAPLSGPHGYGHPRLRVGYLSSDFVSHAVSILTAELYQLHDRDRVEVYGFCWSREDGSPLRARVLAGMDHHIRIGAMSDEAAARCIRDHEIDVLIDLHGLTSGARPNILSYRPAPVQLTYLGFPGTTALPAIDYVLADQFVLPPETAAFFTEKPLYLPDTFQVNDRQRAIGTRPSRAACGLPEQGFVFCSFNNNFKFTQEVFSVWMRILARTPGSVLWLVADSDVVQANLRAAAARDGIDPARLIFAARVLPADYLARFQVADLFLDTFPFGAGTTASDALWAGLPLLTCAGAVFASRMAGSLLRAVELPELITYDFGHYEELAVTLAGQPGRIAAMKRQLDENRMRCALFDSPRLVRNLEEALFRVAKPAPPMAAPAVPQIAAIPIITVSYNSPDLIEALLTSLRRFYDNKVYVIDGSHPEIAAQIGAIAGRFANVEFIAFGYNIHHGPGLSWAINNLELAGPVLFLDSDVEIVRHGFLESLLDNLTPQMYGVGGIQQVNERGDDVDDGPVAYLHPACMLCNIEVVRQWPLPIKHGAPLVQTMLALHRAGASDLIRNLDWVKSDFSRAPERIFIKHDWQGTVIRTGGYHYDLPAASAAVNAELLAQVPLTAQKLVEVGCHDGSFAKAYKQRNPISNYTGIELERHAADLARAHCDFVFNLDVEAADAHCLAHVAGADCWILGEVLEQLDDPWTLLATIRASIAPGGTVVAALRNFQHWQTQARLSLGDLRYQDGEGGALRKAERRVFTRGTILELFQQAGFRVVGGQPKIADEPEREKFLPAIRMLAAASGNDPETAVRDALPWQYIIVAVAP